MPPLTEPIAFGHTAEVYAWEDGKVLKLYYPDYNQTDADREALIARLVYAAGLPSPAVFDVIDIGQRRGIVFERIKGTAMLDSLSHHPWNMPRLARQLADLQLSLHAQSAPKLRPLHSTLAFNIQHAIALPNDLRELALRALARLPEGDRLCHGDLHPGNVILTARGPVLIDWMNACSGNPFADVARTQLLLTLSAIPQDIPLPLRVALQGLRNGLFQTYLRRYLARTPDPQGQICAWLPVLAAARFSENIPAEHPGLLKLLRAELGPAR